MNKLYKITINDIVTNNTLANIAMNHLNKVYAESLQFFQLLEKKKLQAEVKLHRTINSKSFKNKSIDKQKCIKRIQSIEVTLLNREITKLKKKFPFIKEDVLTKSIDNGSSEPTELPKIQKLCKDGHEKTKPDEIEYVNCSRAPFINKFSLGRPFIERRKNQKTRTFEFKCKAFKKALDQNNTKKMDDLCRSIAIENQERMQEFIDSFIGLDRNQAEFIRCISDAIGFTHTLDHNKGKLQNLSLDYELIKKVRMVQKASEDILEQPLKEIVWQQASYQGITQDLGNQSIEDLDIHDVIDSFSMVGDGFLPETESPQFKKYGPQPKSDFKSPSYSAVTPEENIRKEILDQFIAIHIANNKPKLSKTQTSKEMATSM